MGEISFYAADDVFIRDGAMIVRAQNRPMGGRSYTSGQASTRFDFQYGRVEIRAKMPKGQGFWPALWMLPSDGSTSGWLPEIDIYESINNEGRYFGNHHFPTGSGQSQLGPIPVNTDTTAWHVYGFDWTPDSLTWTLDGQPVVSTTNVAASNQHRMFLLITFALGGSWPGPPDGSTPWPSEMQIDYVKVMQQG
jgi:beta-glucanase (GH16 family)